MPTPEERPHQPRDEKPAVQYVTVVDVDIKFWTMVWLMIKWSIAVIPAAIILFGLAALVIAVLTAIGMNLPN
jgi:hypothetical protein